MTRFRPSPRPLSTTLERLAHQLTPETVLAEAQAAWPQAVGEAIAQRSRPVAERTGLLTVSCESSVWAQELDLMGDTILERLNQRLQRGQIARLRCVAGAGLEQGWQGPR